MLYSIVYWSNFDSYSVRWYICWNLTGLRKWSGIPREPGLRVLLSEHSWVRCESTILNNAVSVGLQGELWARALNAKLVTSNESLLAIWIPQVALPKIIEQLSRTQTFPGDWDHDDCHAHGTQAKHSWWGGY